MEKLHPKAKVLFFIQYFFIFAFLIFIFWNFLLPFWFLEFFSIGAMLTGLIFAPLLVIILLAWLWAELTYNNWGYELRKEGVYIQRGVIWKHYSSIPYERVQNIDINRGVIARICGFSALNIQTAGYSAQKGPFSEGFIPALEPKKAESYREKILKAIKGKKQGL